MKVVYNGETDILRIIFRDVPVEDYNEEQPNVTVEYDADDQMIALRIKNASTMVDNPRSTEHIVEGATQFLDRR